jgi:outer membrane biosynthesis protein TonB
MTGQRNENSVLFSLSNLQQLASQGGAQPQAAQPAPVQPASVSTGSSPQASGEGSGLIDIRALAQSTAGKADTAPTQAVDDLLAIGAGTGGAMGTPLLGPAPLESSDSNRWIWIAGAAVAVLAIVGAGVGVGMAFGGSDDDALEIAAPINPQPAAQQAAPSNPEPAAAAPQPEEPVQEAAVVDIEPEEPAEAATLDEPAKPAERQRTAPKKRSSTQRRRTSQQSATTSPTPKRKSNNLDALMDEVVGGSSAPKSRPKQTSTGSSSSSAGLPDSPSRNDVKTALQGVSGAVKSCRKDEGGTAIVDVVFSGKTGRVSSAKVTSGPFKGTPVGACVASAVKRARVPRFKQSSFKVTFPYRL